MQSINRFPMTTGAGRLLSSTSREQREGVFLFTVRRYGAVQSEALVMQMISVRASYHVHTECSQTEAMKPVNQFCLLLASLVVLIFLDCMLGMVTHLHVHFKKCMGPSD